MNYSAAGSDRFIDGFLHYLGACNFLNLFGYQRGKLGE